jgi:hypothetical protein
LLMRPVAGRARTAHRRSSRNLERRLLVLLRRDIAAI